MFKPLGETFANVLVYWCHADRIQIEEVDPVFHFGGLRYSLLPRLVMNLWVLLIHAYLDIFYTALSSVWQGREVHLSPTLSPSPMQWLKWRLICIFVKDTYCYSTENLLNCHLLCPSLAGHIYSVVNISTVSVYLCWKGCLHMEVLFNPQQH